MIKLTILVFFFSITLLSNPSFSLELTVKINKLKKLDKKIRFELYLVGLKQPKKWNNLQLVNSDYVVVGPEKNEIFISQLDHGRYALRIYQDLNNNGKLDKSSSNIPLEPIGFSENPSLFSGEPLPEDAAFELRENMSMAITLKHRKAKRIGKKPR